MEHNRTVDPQFKAQIQVKKPGAKLPNQLVIWRIENLQLQPIDKNSYGSFYNGDSYVLYYYSNNNGKFDEEHIHFWLGSQTSQDEAGVAAYKTVELDDYLGGAPVQHREVEGHESDKFKSYFPSGIRILQGGVASGLKEASVLYKFTPKLHIVKGKIRPVIRQLPKITWGLMNHGDVFILQLKEAIFIWEGESANKYEKMQAAKLAMQLKQESTSVGPRTNPPPIIFAVDGQESTMTAVELKLFETHLPLSDKNKNIKSADTEGKDSDIDLLVAGGSGGMASKHQLKLFLCTDETGTLRVTEVKGGPLAKSDLKSEDSYIIDNGPHGIWAWIGKRASPKERTEAMSNAQGFVQKRSYPATTRVTRVIDGGEPEEFKCLFKTWKDANEVTGFGKTHSFNRIASMGASFDAASMHNKANQSQAGKNQQVNIISDEGNGPKTVWKINQFKRVEVPGEMHGLFWEHDCYLVKYTSADGKNIVIYYWLGIKSPAEDRGACALHAVELDDETGGHAVQVRIVQGQEPSHFLSIFGGQMVVYSGDAEDCNFEAHKPYLLHVRGNGSNNAKATQVPMITSSLNSNDVFIVAGEVQTWIWCGKGCTGDEREVAKSIAMKDRVDCVTVYEGQERDDFWHLLGGKGPYANDKRLAEETEGTFKAPRLFQCSNASTGVVKATEIINFTQQDLSVDDVMLLDIGHTLFVWFGVESNKQEQVGSVKIAQTYLKTDPSGPRGEDSANSACPILIVKQGHEPVGFKGFFGVWDDQMWESTQDFNSLKASMQQSQIPLTADDILSSATDELDTLNFNECKKYPLNMLVTEHNSADALPRDVNPSRRELHLTSEDFQLVFAMDWDTFAKLPKWKQTQVKKAKGMF